MIEPGTDRTTNLSSVSAGLLCFCLLVGCTTSFGGGKKDTCGNGILEGREECDDGNLVDGDGCSSECKVEPGWECEGEPSVCVSVAVCGDGKAEGDESCDGSDMRGQTCESLGYGPGELVCDADCEFVLEGCGPPPDCGNGILDPGEICDGDELGGMTCESLGYYGGVLGCLHDCSDFDLSGCMGRCGDGVVDEPEKCDGDNLDGKNCAYFGFYGGRLNCLDDCSDFDKSDCWDEPIVLINEVSTGATDWVELLNVSSVGVNLQAWVFAWEAVTAGEILTGWSALPDVLVFPGERLTITEDPRNSGGQPYLSGESDVQLGKNIPWGRFGGGAVLSDPSDRPTDMIRWGESAMEVEGTGWADVPTPLPGYQKEGVSFSRVPDGQDSDRSSDFCFAQSTKGLSNLLPCLQPYGPSSLVITEVSGGGLWNAETIEIYNPGNEPVELENWQVVTNRPLGTNFLFLPSYSLGPGDYAHIVCNVGAFGSHHVDENGIIRIRSMSWSPGGTNYLVLREPVAGLGVDFLRWGGSAMVPWSPDEWYDDDNELTMPDRSLSLGRIGVEDTNTSDDWCVQEQSFGELNQGCID